MTPGRSAIIWMAMCDGYDRDGYLLFDPRDDSKTDFSWIYH
jgi:hypothetical protein